MYLYQKNNFKMLFDYNIFVINYYEVLDEHLLTQLGVCTGHQAVESQEHQQYR